MTLRAYNPSGMLPSGSSRVRTSLWRRVAQAAQDHLPQSRSCCVTPPVDAATVQPHEAVARHHFEKRIASVVGLAAACAAWGGVFIPLNNRAIAQPLGRR